METTQLTIIEKSAEILKTGGDILTRNMTIAAKAESVGRNILKEIQDNGGVMSSALDTRCNDFISKCKQRKSELNENRKGITQIIDEVKKAFTEQENKLYSTKEGTITNQLQAYRNSYAKKVAEEEKEREEKAERIAKEQQEKIEVKAKIQLQLIQFFEGYLLTKKQSMQNSFNACDLNNIDAFKSKVENYNPIYSKDEILKFKPTVTSFIVNDSEILLIAKTILDEKFSSLAERFANEINAFKVEIIDKIPSKKSEILEQEEAKLKAYEAELKRKQEIEKADGEKKKQLEEEARIAEIAEKERLEKQRAAQLQREQEDAKRIEQEAAEKQRQGELQAQMGKEAETTQILFDKEIAAQSSVEGPETRSGYKIVINHQAGFAQIFMFWWENEGIKLPLDKIENTKISQMVTFCEKYALKFGTKIESKYVKYEEEFTAINRKAK